MPRLHDVWNVVIPLRSQADLVVPDNGGRWQPERAQPRQVARRCCCGKEIFRGFRGALTAVSDDDCNVRWRVSSTGVEGTVCHALYRRSEERLVGKKCRS